MGPPAVGHMKSHSSPNPYVDFTHPIAFHGFVDSNVVAGQAMAGSCGFSYHTATMLSPTTSDGSRRARAPAITTDEPSVTVTTGTNVQPPPVTRTPSGRVTLWAIARLVIEKQVRQV